MKRVIPLIVMLASMAILSAQNKKGFNIEVEITNVESGQGQLLIGLYNSEGEWLVSPYKGLYGEIVNGKCEVVFSNVLNGTYAISVFHDKDNDGELDTFLGIPTEDTGSSNNAPARFGPPKWKDAKFKINSASIKQSIKL